MIFNRHRMSASPENLIGEIAVLLEVWKAASRAGRLQAAMRIAEPIIITIVA